MASEVDKFIEELKSGTAWVCKELPNHGEQGEMMLELLKNMAEVISKQEKDKECH